MPRQKRAPSTSRMEVSRRFRLSWISWRLKRQDKKLAKASRKYSLAQEYLELAGLRLSSLLEEKQQLQFQQREMLEIRMYRVEGRQLEPPLTPAQLEQELLE